MNKKREFKYFLRILVKTVWAAGLMAILTSCGTSPGYNYTISGTISGMIGSGLVLQDNGGDNRSVTTNGAFAFVTALTTGTTYSVTVLTQPTNPSQTCVVSNSSGTISGSPVQDVAVSCVMNSSPVTVDPSGYFAYVANSGPGNIDAYTINQTTGALTLTGTFTAGTYPSQVTVDPSGNFAYVANLGDDTISAYTIDNTSGSPTYGELTLTGTFTAGTSPVSVTIYPASSGASAYFAYVPNMGSGNVSVYTINTNGSLTPSYNTPTVTTGTSPVSVTIYPTSSGASAYFAYVPNMTDGTISAYTINTDGSLTPSYNTPTVAAGTYPVSFTTYTGTSGAYAYVANIGSGNISLYTINSDGSLSTNGNAVTADIYPASVTIYPNSTGSYAYAYVSNMGSSDITAFEISPSSGVFETYVPGSNFATGTYPNPVTLYPPLSGAFAYVSDRNDGNIWVYSINETNGALTNIQIITTTTGTASLTTVTIDPNGPYAYVSDVNTGLVYAFTINPDGSLTAVP
jgi:6-phosphogluconolactonase (cycloisomerase 2 family)